MGAFVKLLPYLEAFAQGFLGVLAIAGQPSTDHLATASFTGLLAAVNLLKKSPKDGSD